MRPPEKTKSAANEGSDDDARSLQRRRMLVRGVVQGVGFRPFVYGLATERALTGFVRNDASGVLLEVQGSAETLDDFAARLTTVPPPLAHIDEVQVVRLPLLAEAAFLIVHSESSAQRSTPVSPDMGTCDECLAELRDPADRRFGYPFVNCTHCGPRFTIQRDIPYDRSLTTMHAFRMCARCQAEYDDPRNRRFHAQPNACPDCGPQVWFVSAAAALDASACAGPTLQQVSGAHAVDACVQALGAGQIVAVKGIGGFHLACDAADDEAIARLRIRKGRVDKPFAVMVADLEQARACALLDPHEEALLVSRSRPIVLLKRRSDAGALSACIAPGNDRVGLMLPYSPLHYLLVGDRPLVMTSGNVGDEPIARTNVDAQRRLVKLADAFLLHDREIHSVCDDSVVRVCEGRTLPVRRSRGYAPLPVCLANDGASVLAVGGELKAAFCVTRGNYAFMSQHIGDLGTLDSLEMLRAAVRHFLRLFRVSPQQVVCDLHPGYVSSRWAAEFAEQENLPLLKVQHHHAHIASLLAEHQYGGTEAVIGVSLDGTGYGTDGAIWGGEVLLVSPSGFERAAHLKYAPLPGGDAAIARPYRVALAHLWAAGLPWSERLPCVAMAAERGELDVLRRQLESNLHCVSTSSMGRLFDAAASLLGVRQTVNYEAQAAMELEALAEKMEDAAPYAFEIHDGRPMVADPRPLLTALVKDCLREVPPARVASRFHRSIVELIATLCRRVRESRSAETVALSGGVFQNVTLLRAVARRLDADGFRVMLHRVVPPNDGGLALGQAMIARWQ